MKLTLVRHGQTIENVQNILQGHMQGSLSALGCEQAAETVLKLKDDVFTVIMSSDLQRCRQTSEIIRAYHESTPFIVTTELRERDCGEYQGKVFDEVVWNALPGDYETRKYPGGESWGDVTVRIAPFLDKLFQSHADDTVLLVTHGGVVRSIISLLQQRSLSSVNDDGTPNAGIWRLQMNTLLT